MTFLSWPARRDLNPQSSESESDALSNYATGGFITSVLYHSDTFSSRRICFKISEAVFLLFI